MVIGISGLGGLGGGIVTQSPNVQGSIQQRIDSEQDREIARLKDEIDDLRRRNQ